MRMSALFGVKNFGFFKNFGVFARTRGERKLSQCGHFVDKEGVNFSRFCADVFYGRPVNNILLQQMKI